jgi:hypothetical protein
MPKFCQQGNHIMPRLLAEAARSVADLFEVGVSKSEVIDLNHKVRRARVL